MCLAYLVGDSNSLEQAIVSAQPLKIPSLIGTRAASITCWRIDDGQVGCYVLGQKPKKAVPICLLQCDESLVFVQRTAAAIHPQLGSVHLLLEPCFEVRDPMRSCFKHLCHSFKCGLLLSISGFAIGSELKSTM